MDLKNPILDFLRDVSSLILRNGLSAWKVDPIKKPNNDFFDLLELFIGFLKVCQIFEEISEPDLPCQILL